MNPGFVAASDWHLAPGAWLRHPALAGDAYYSLQQIVDYCINQQLPLVAPGDLLDRKQTDPQSLAFLYGQMTRMQAAGLPVYYTQGQHEFFATDATVGGLPGQTWMSGHPWPTHIHRKLVEVGGYRLYGLDWTPATRVKQELEDVPQCDMLVCHQVWKEHTGYNAECSLAEFAQLGRTSGVLSGDYHVTKVYRLQDRMWVLSPGSTCMQDIAESPAKYLLRVRSDWVVEQVPLATRSAWRYEVTDEQGLESLLVTLAAMQQQVATDLASLPEAIRRPIVAVRYVSDVPNAFPRLAAALQSWAEFMPDECRREQIVEQVQPLNTTNLASWLDVTSLDPTGFTYQSLYQLLAASDVKAQTQVVVTEFLRRYDEEHGGQTENLPGDGESHPVQAGSLGR